MGAVAEERDDGIWMTVQADGSAKLVRVVAYEPQPVGAPRKVVTEDGEKYVTLLARRGCLLSDIAEEMCISKPTLFAPHNHERVKKAYERGYAECNNRLRAAQTRRALDGNSAMLIWLGKVRLGQREEAPPEQWPMPTPDRDEVEKRKAELRGMLSGDALTASGPLLDELAEIEAKARCLRMMPMVSAGPDGTQRPTPYARLYREMVAKETDIVRMVLRQTRREGEEEDSPLRAYLRALEAREDGE